MTIEHSLLPVLAFVAACAFPAAGADAPPKQAATDAVPAGDVGKTPLIIHNPDGTMTVQTEPASAKTEGAGQKELVIPPQIVVPTVRVTANDTRNEPH